jgi:hypothetical protein
MTNPLPKFFRLKQIFDAPILPDPAAGVRAALAALPAASFIRPGMSVAVGAGSRGISNYDVIVRTVCEEVKSLGAHPFIVPAMGSHGGATAVGQLEVLAHFGVTEERMGAPVRSGMDTVELGRAGGFIVYQDRLAAGADAIVLVNRIKPHTAFHGPVESGLMKMAAVGLGKQDGANQFHQAAARMGHSAALLAVAREALQLGKFAFGVAIIENQFHQTARVVAVPAAKMETEEMRLLERARSLAPRLPFAGVDLLIVDEMGKNLSGSGMDTNVIRRMTEGGLISASPDAARRVYVRSLHPDSFGNAYGIGLADFTHDRLVRAMDAKATWVNVLTASAPGNARVPMHFPTDREALVAALQTTGHTDLRDLRVLWIKNTLSCGTLLASEACLAEARGRADLTPLDEPAPALFDDCGDLEPVF